MEKAVMKMFKYDTTNNFYEDNQKIKSSGFFYEHHLVSYTNYFPATKKLMY